MIRTKKTIKRVGLSIPLPIYQNQDSRLLNEKEKETKLVYLFTRVNGVMKGKVDAQNKKSLTGISCRV